MLINGGSEGFGIGAKDDHIELMEGDVEERRGGRTPLCAVAATASACTVTALKLAEVGLQFLVNCTYAVYD